MTKSVGIIAIGGEEGDQGFVLPDHAQAVDKWLQEVASPSTAAHAKKINRIWQEESAKWDDVKKQGSTAAKIASRIRTEMPEYTKNRAAMIATTNANWAFNRGARIEYINMGVTVLEWMTTEDDALCPFCAAMDGAMVSANDPFWHAGSEFGVETPPKDDGGEGGLKVLKLKHEISHPPLHPRCRCTLLPVISSESVPVKVDDNDDDLEIDLTKPVKKPKPPKPLKKPAKPKKPQKDPAPKPEDKPKPKPDRKPKPEAKPKPESTEEMNGKELRQHFLKHKKDAEKAEKQARKELDTARKEYEKFIKAIVKEHNISEFDARDLEEARKYWNQKVAPKDKLWAKARAAREPNVAFQRKMAHVPKERQMDHTCAIFDGPPPGHINKVRKAEEFVNSVTDKATLSVQPSLSSRYGNNMRNPIYEDRAYYLDHMSEYVTFLDSEIETHIHEISHHLERIRQNGSQLTKAFLDKRCAGEAYVKLKDLYPNSSYADNEICRPDQFKDAYVGKHYDEPSTEVISMGVQYLYESPFGFASEDPDYFEFIIDFLRGNI